jgi:Ca2+ transporting ATPase
LRRNGKIEKDVHYDNIKVGDILFLKGGNAIPVDGIVVHSSGLTISEAAMTGESDSLQKETLEYCLQKKKENDSMIEREAADNKTAPKPDHHAVCSPLIMSGTEVSVGEGELLVIMVGKHSAIGKIMATLEQKSEDTPL